MFQCYRALIRGDVDSNISERKVGLTDIDNLKLHCRQIMTVTLADGVQACQLAVLKLAGPKVGKWARPGSKVLRVSSTRESSRLPSFGQSVEDAGRYPRYIE